MPGLPIRLRSSHPLTVGSFGNADTLRSISASEIADSCDLVEIRLDLLDAATRHDAPWRNFTQSPILFTARRGSEGGTGDLDADTRMALLSEQLDDTSLIDIEVASIAEMQPLIKRLKELDIPWIASFHDFHGVPEIAQLQAAKMKAREAGAAAFKAATELGWDLASIGPLAHFVANSDDYPISLMGMGPLAPASRVMFAQLGSVLNYGYVGNTPTAPGQWSARQLHEAIQHVQKRPPGQA
ncbi:type I 3-dehydroquinate dehydratase [Haloferula rosea]|uniref:3-dehydroquinate dehydratase n=1 Tax=Haloferula rosea TaxID=490093 RepID=A0A934VH62_9BACT|nr:type I 3-dehydroquinate dehydratase [Haloferula rosea]MBK1828751.1 type I 3-dehydroquinate dehydratase [Haloferula rosea]